MDDEFEEWVSHFSPPRPDRDPKIHGKGLFPHHQFCPTICDGDLGLPIRVIVRDEVPTPRTRVIVGFISRLRVGSKKH